MLDCETICLFSEETKTSNNYENKKQILCTVKKKKLSQLKILRQPTQLNVEFSTFNIWGVCVCVYIHSTATLLGTPVQLLGNTDC